VTTTPIRTFDDALAALDAGFPSDPAEATRRYRALARMLHPDTAPPGRGDQATDAFARLTRQWRGRDGGRETVTTPARRYVLGRTLATGDLAVLRHARWDEDGRRREAVMKIPLRPRDNDLMEHEAHVLTRLDTVGERRHRAYAPALVESFRHRPPTAPSAGSTSSPRSPASTPSPRSPPPTPAGSIPGTRPGCGAGC
jgi:hypothetical protein